MALAMALAISGDRIALISARAIPASQAARIMSADAGPAK